MPFEIIKVDDRARDVLLELSESYTADLKAIEVAPGRLTKSLSSFCNADGGELFIGVDEDRASGTRTWRGFANIEAANGHVQALEAFFPLGRDVDYEFLSHAGDPDAGLILKITLRRTPDYGRPATGVSTSAGVPRTSRSTTRACGGWSTRRAAGASRPSRSTSPWRW